MCTLKAFTGQPAEFILQRLTYLQCPNVPSEYSTICFVGQCSKFQIVSDKQSPDRIFHSYKASERGGQWIYISDHNGYVEQIDNKIVKNIFNVHKRHVQLNVEML